MKILPRKNFNTVFLSWLSLTFNDYGGSVERVERKFLHIGGIEISVKRCYNIL